VFHIRAGIAGEHVSVPHFDRTKRPGVKGGAGRNQPIQMEKPAKWAETG
jgi:hypothetical protein